LALVGLGTGLAVIAWAGAAVAHRSGAVEDPATLIEATHLPPLLTLPGEAVTLRYDIYCAPPGNDPESGAPCDAGGSVFVRPGGVGPFRRIDLRLDPGASQGRYAAIVPPDVASDAAGFTYYAVLRSRTSGATTTVPAGGPFAPQRSRQLVGAVTAVLGAHDFGSPLEPTARVASARWGNGDGEVGLEQGPGLQPIGASSFDVGANGAVSILDEANRRVLRFAPGAAPNRIPDAVPVAVRGTIADLAVAANGGMTVLETVGEGSATPLVRSFDANGRSLGSWHVAEDQASALAIGPGGPVALQYPAGQWMPVAERGAGLTAPMQRVRGRSGRPLPGGDELVSQREGDEVRIALVGPAGVLRGWRITSQTPLGEIQLARVLGSDVVVVFRVYDDARDEFEVLVLDGEGIARRFAVDSQVWAETAPLSRFRLQGSSLYELGSTSAGVFVDRYDLEVTR